MNFVNALEVERQSGRLKTRLLIGQLVIMAIMAFGWSAAPSQITLHYPPDLRQGATMKIGEISDAEIYLFAEYISQQLNNWPNNGEKDYQLRIRSLRPYFTPEYQANLQLDYDHRKKQGELRKRVRNWSPVPGTTYDDSFVEKIGAHGWVVWLDVQIREYVSGGKVKEIVLKVPMRVVSYDVNRETNPWGLALDGPGQYNPRVVEIKSK